MLGPPLSGRGAAPQGRCSGAAREGAAPAGRVTRQPAGYRCGADQPRSHTPTPSDRAAATAAAVPEPPGKATRPQRPDAAAAASMARERSGPAARPKRAQSAGHTRTGTPRAAAHAAAHASAPRQPPCQSTTGPRCRKTTSSDRQTSACSAGEPPKARPPHTTKTNMRQHHLFAAYPPHRGKGVSRRRRGKGARSRERAPAAPLRRRGYNGRAWVVPTTRGRGAARQADRRAQRSATAGTIGRATRQRRSQRGTTGAARQAAQSEQRAARAERGPR